MPVAGQESSSSREVTPVPLQADDWIELQTTLDAGLRFLARSQQSASGAVGSQYPVAVTSLAGMAALGAGYLPTQGRHGEFLHRCVRYLRTVADSRPDRFITETGEAASRMHGHCYAVLFMAQVAGSLRAEEEAQAVALIRSGVRVIRAAQSREGGWYYAADNAADEDEASVTVCALQALRAARNIGIAVDSFTRDQAIRYVKRCQLPSGAFCYALRERSKSTYALTVAALSTLNAAGVYESEELRKGKEWVRHALEREGADKWDAAGEEFPYYANFYAAQFLYQEGGPLWREWYASVRDHLMKTKKTRGEQNEVYWESRYGDEYGTAMALLILEVPLAYLPIFQR